MKLNILIILILLFQTKLCYGQEIAPAPEGMAVVYFIRTSTTGELINFSFYDQTKYMGKFNGSKYIRYECEPGEHLFWAAAENRDFIEADLDTGKVYLIEVIPLMGFAKASVKLAPVNQNDPKKMNKINKLILKKPPVALTNEELDLDKRSNSQIIDSGIQKYQEEKEKGKITTKLTKTMFYRID